MLNIANITDKKDDLINDLKNMGVSASAVFPVNEIKFDTVLFRDMCKQNLCGRYGKNYKCPPHIGEPEDLKNEVLTYDTAILIQTIHPLEDSYDFEGMNEGSDIHSQNIQKVREYINKNFSYANMLALGAGGCSLCPKCGVVDGTPCRFPDNAISSVEGYCMDVANMTNSHGLKYINGVDTVSYVAVFLLK